jgi:ribosomal protein S6--L-glutamate ligase
MTIYILSTNPNLYSTKRLLSACLDAGHDARVINHTKCTILSEKGEPMLYYDGERLEMPDAVIPRIGASVTFFGVSVVRQFEVMDVYTTASSQAIVRSRDKLRSLQIMSEIGIGIPRTGFAKHPKDKDVEMLLKSIGKPPYIIKLLEGTQGLGVVLAETSKAAKSVVEAFSGLKTNILVQEFIKEAGGSDVRAFVVNGKVVAAMKRTGAEGDFRSNIHRGGTARVIKLNATEKKTAVEAAKAMGLKVAGVDILQSEKGPLVLEVNSSPGLEGIEKATGVDIAGMIAADIDKQVSLKKNKTRRVRKEV